MLLSGCAVWFKPSPTEETPSNSATRLAYGICTGYHLRLGGFLSGENGLFDLDGITVGEIIVNTPSRTLGRVPAHIVLDKCSDLDYIPIMLFKFRSSVRLTG